MTRPAKRATPVPSRPSKRGGIAPIIVTVRKVWTTGFGQKEPAVVEISVPTIPMLRKPDDKILKLNG